MSQQTTAIAALKQETSFEDLQKELNTARLHLLDEQLDLPHEYLQEYCHTLDLTLAALAEVMQPPKEKNSN